MEVESLIFLLLIALISFVYSSVGHGGASGYIALMTLWGLQLSDIRNTALIINTFVSFIAFIQFYRMGHFRWPLSYPFVIASVPMAFLGSQFKIDQHLYQQLVGVILVFSITRLLGYGNKVARSRNKLNPLLAMTCGAAIGFISGLIGIGGGIILSPLILLVGWGGMKETAATSAFFIFVNSIAGLGGLMFNQELNLHPEVASWVGLALVGGFAGSYWGSKFAPVRHLSFALAIGLAIASFKLIFF